MACTHRGCRCVETPVRRGDERYCSEKCADVQTSGKVQTSGRHEERCPCGHKQCKGREK